MICLLLVLNVVLYSKLGGAVLMLHRDRLYLGFLLGVDVMYTIHSLNLFAIPEAISASRQNKRVSKIGVYVPVEVV